MQKILIIQTAFIGDVILATSLIEKIVVNFPGSQIYFLLRKGNEDILIGNPHLQEVWVWDKTKNKYRNLLGIIKKIRNHKFDIVIGLQRYFSGGILVSFSGTKLKIGYRNLPFSLFYNISNTFRKNSFSEVHEIERIQNLISGITDHEIFYPKLFPSEADVQSVTQYYHSDFITISPASVWFTKQLPAEKWIELISQIPTDTEIIFLGGKNDFDFCESIKNQCKANKTLNLSGKITILQTAALMTKAKMNFANDSAPTHIASSVNAPITTFFCSTLPGFGFYPLSERAEIIETKDKLDCRPCGIHGQKKCPKQHFKCATTIKIPAVEF